MDFYILCADIFNSLVKQLMRSGRIPYDRSALGRSELDGKFGSIIHWRSKDGKIEYKFRIMIQYKSDGKSLKPSSVLATFQDKDSHEYTSMEEFESPISQEWIAACIKT